MRAHHRLIALASFLAISAAARLDPEGDVHQLAPAASPDMPERGSQARSRFGLFVLAVRAQETSLGSASWSREPDGRTN